MKVAVIGLGAVGTEIIGILTCMPEVNEIVCVNRTRAKAEGEVMDLLHAASFVSAGSPRLRVGQYEDLEGSDIVIVSVGAQAPHIEVRDDLLKANYAIIRSIVPELMRYASKSIVLVVTNPVDVISQLMLDYTSFARERLISLGTLVDTARLMRVLGRHTNLDPKNISGYVLGDHSETGFVPWSVCNICGMELDAFCRLNDVPLVDRVAVKKEVMGAGLSILRKKGNTSRGIGASVCRVVRAIATDEKSILPVGVLLDGEYGIDRLVMSVPCVIGRGGAERILQIVLSDDEVAEFATSEAHLRRSLAKVNAGASAR